MEYLPLLWRFGCTRMEFISMKVWMSCLRELCFENRSSWRQVVTSFLVAGSCWAVVWIPTSFLHYFLFLEMVPRVFVTCLLPITIYSIVKATSQTSQHMQEDLTVTHALDHTRILFLLQDQDTNLKDSDDTPSPQQVTHFFGIQDQFHTFPIRDNGFSLVTHRNLIFSSNLSDHRVQEQSFLKSFCFISEACCRSTARDSGGRE